MADNPPLPTKNKAYISARIHNSNFLAVASDDPQVWFEYFAKVVNWQKKC